MYNIQSRLRGTVVALVSILAVASCGDDDDNKRADAAADAAPVADAAPAVDTRVPDAAVGQDASPDRAVDMATDVASDVAPDLGLPDTSPDVAPTIVSITVTPVNPMVFVGRTQQLTATALYSDNSSRDVSAQATWASSDMAIGTVVATGTGAGLFTAVAAGDTTVTATVGTVKGTQMVKVNAVTLSAITIDPVDPSLAKGTQQAFTATGVYTDGSKRDLTTMVTWASSMTGIATVSNTAGSQGVADAVAQGTSVISASVGAVSGATTLTVTPATLKSLSIAPTAPTLAKGSSASFTAQGLFSDGTNQDLTTQVEWSSSMPAVATVSIAAGSEGKVVAVAMGQSVIEAKLMGKMASTTVTVTSAVLSSIVISPKDPSLPVGASANLQATGVYSDMTTQDLTTQVTWTSAMPAIASFASNPMDAGYVSGVSVGMTMVSAALGEVTGTATLKITGARLNTIEITPANPSIPKGTTVGLTATGKFSDGTSLDITRQVAWGSSNNAVAQVSNARGSAGVATGRAVGTATVTTLFLGASGSTTLNVTAATLQSIGIQPPNPSLARGTTRSLRLNGVYSDGTSQDLTSSATWESSNTAVATVSNAAGDEGVVTGVSAGMTTISATVGSLMTTAQLTVREATLTSIAVTPTNGTVSRGGTLQMKATATFSDMSTQDVTTQVTWAVSNINIASVSNAAGSEGTLTGGALGMVMVSAFLGGVSGSTMVTVAAATLTSVVLMPSELSLAKGTSQSLKALALFSDSTSQDVTAMATWGTGNMMVATVMAGVVTGATEGSTSITATYSGQVATATVTVTPPLLTSLAITPMNGMVAKGAMLAFKATATLSDGSTQDVTNDVTWASSNSAAATISNEMGSKGIATGVDMGMTSISAVLAGITDTAVLVVTMP